MRSRSARACDEAGFFWYEDPYRDTGGAIEGHKRLRERLRDAAAGRASTCAGWRRRRRSCSRGGGDIMHADPGIRHGHHRRDEDRCISARRSAWTCSITPAVRRIGRSMAATPNTHFYEMALDRPGHAQRGAAGLRLRLFRSAGRGRGGWLRAGAGRSRARRHLRLGIHLPKPDKPMSSLVGKLRKAHFTPSPLEKAPNTVSR